MNPDLSKEMAKKAAGRQKFMHGDQVIYEWEQDLNEVNIYITPPEFMLSKNKEIIKQNLKPGQKVPKFNITITNKHVKIGVDQNPPYIDENLFKNIDTDESLWMIEDDELHILLQKAVRAEVWECVFVGHGKIDPMLQEEMQKKILQERFQMENPGFDFSGAEMNGMVPDPKNFMGGMDYSKLK